MKPIARRQLPDYMDMFKYQESMLVIGGFDLDREEGMLHIIGHLPDTYLLRVSYSYQAQRVDDPRVTGIERDLTIGQNVGLFVERLSQANIPSHRVPLDNKVRELSLDPRRNIVALAERFTELGSPLPTHQTGMQGGFYFGPR